MVPHSKTIVLGAGSSNGLDIEKFTRTPELETAAAQIRESFGIPSNAVVIGYVGRLVRDKGLIELIEAWRTLKEEFPLLHMLLVGPFEDGDPVPADVEHTLRHDERIHLACHVPSGPEAYYAAMDVLHCQ